MLCIHHEILDKLRYKDQWTEKVIQSREVIEDAKSQLENNLNGRYLNLKMLLTMLIYTLLN